MVDRLRTFQLKHMRQLIAELTLAPTDLATRVEHALISPMPVAALELERLVDETLSLAEQSLPTVDVTPLRRNVGRRLRPWSLAETG